MGVVSDNFNWDAPIMDEDNAEWPKTLSWGGLPKDGAKFMEYMGWNDLGRANQREAVEDFMESPRSRHMPGAVRQFFVDLGLLE